MKGRRVTHKKVPVKKKAPVGTPSPAAVPPPFPQVHCYSWRPSGGRINFGDQLAEVIVDSVLMSRGRLRSEEVRRPARLLSVGSVLHFARSGDTVWGTGVNGKIVEEHHRFEALDVRAVRGPLTADFLRGRGIAVPEVYGDPALLIPRLLPGRFVPTGKEGPIFVPNLNDLPHVASLALPIPMVSPLRGWNHVISRIVASRFVLASSLHGLIIAEAYGVPARYVRLTERETLFKYQDYHAGTGRTDLTFATSIEQGLEMGGMPGISVSFDPLLDAFPHDLWSDPAP